MNMNRNPAKIFLRQYLALTGRIDALTDAINSAMDRAFNISVTLKQVQVKSSPAEHDTMARDVCNAVDATELLRTERDEASKKLFEILTAINSLKDERQKELLTMRYVNGFSFAKIQQKMGYEQTQTYVIHGRALVEINKWLVKNHATYSPL